jgi:hypothetical protein
MAAGRLVFLWLVGLVGSYLLWSHACGRGLFASVVVSFLSLWEKKKEEEKNHTRTYIHNYVDMWYKGCVLDSIRVSSKRGCRNLSQYSPGHLSLYHI